MPEKDFKGMKAVLVSCQTDGVLRDKLSMTVNADCHICLCHVSVLYNVFMRTL